MENGFTSEAEPLVLVIDGDESVLRLLSIKLAKAGFQVLTVSDGERGLAEAEARDPAVVLLDGALTKLDGYHLARALSCHEAGRRPAIVFLSAEASIEAIERALRAGCDDYVVKPFSPEELAHRLRVVLARRRVAAAASELECADSRP